MKIKILYVEDEQTIRENMQRPLNYLCDDLIVAKDGREGLELYKQHHPDIVISDIKMPKMNGIDMCRAIKDMNKNQHIVFTTAYSENNYFIDAIDMQVDGYILKPVDYNLLENKIKNIIYQINIKQKLKEQEILTNEIVKFQDNLLVILDGKLDIIFTNDNFLNFFEISSLKEFKQKYSCLTHLFLENKDYFMPKDKSIKDWISQFLLLEKSKRVVSMMNLHLFTPQSFLVSVNKVKETSHTIILFTEITNITIEKNKFEHKAFTDELTNIYNRAFFNETLKKEILIYKREKIPFSFIIFDIDKFKNFNDTYGHLTGDEVLKNLAKAISSQTRATDIFARWGGEEFVSILPHTALKNAAKIAEHLRKIIQNYTFVDKLNVTCSFGVSQIKENDTKETLIKRADDALYRAKENGRNRVEIEE